MKIGDEEINIFEEDEKLAEVISQWNVIKQKFDRDEFNFPPWDQGYIDAFKEMYHVEFSMEEILELREFMMDGAEFWLLSRIDEDRANGMKEVNLKGLI